MAHVLVFSSSRRVRGTYTAVHPTVDNSFMRGPYNVGTWGGVHATQSSSCDLWRHARSCCSSLSRLVCRADTRGRAHRTLLRPVSCDLSAASRPPVHARLLSRIDSRRVLARRGHSTHARPASLLIRARSATTTMACQWPRRQLRAASMAQAHSANEWARSTTTTPCQQGRGPCASVARASCQPVPPRPPPRRRLAHWRRPLPESRRRRRPSA